MDVDLNVQDVGALASPDALTGFLDRLGYDTSRRAVLTAEAIGLTDSDGAFRHLELLSQDDENFLRVVFAQVRSITAKARNDLVRALGRFSQDHLIILTGDFAVLEFVLIDKVKRHRHGPATVAAYKPVPRVFSVTRKAAAGLDLRILRRLTFTQRDGLEQFDKLRSVFEAAAYTGRYYQNRALFADHYLDTRLRESPAWAEPPNAAFAAVRDIMAGAHERLREADEAATREQLIEPLFKVLGFRHAAGKGAKAAAPVPDYVLKDSAGKPLTVALVYQWDRWLDGPHAADEHTPDENPGAAVVSVLERGDAEWVIVTNGKLWRLYSRKAHSRSTNFYEVDLAEALVASADTDPAEAFRYWWLFFRPQAFAPVAEADPAQCWLDTVAAGSRDYAKQVEERLKKRVFEHIVPHLAMGFLTDRKERLGKTEAPTAVELEEIREACLTLLYRLLFLLYAESRDLLPIWESPYFEKSLRKLQKGIAEKAGTAEDEVDDKLHAAYRDDQAALYDRLAELFTAIDNGDPALNVPTYNGGLFLTQPEAADDSREARIARFLRTHKLPDRHLAQAIDRLSRDPDEKTFGMVFIDFKSLGVRQLGSIYEGLLEFRLKVATEDLTTVKQKGKEKVIPLTQAKRKRAEVAVRKGEVYLANDKGDRKASGSYYTPDHIVEYIVENAVGPVLAEKLEALRPALRKAEKTHHRWAKNLENNVGLVPEDIDPREFVASKTYAEHKNLVEQVFDCKVLDPAMGSGHFLVEAVDFVTDKLLDLLNSFPHNPIATALERTRRSILESLADQGVAVDPDKLTDVHLLKRHVLKRCIYGVDLNPMAVELAKVSLWLDAFTLGAPLSFLDHHLRYGNSLIGEMDVSQHILPGSQREADMLRAVTQMIQIARTADARVEDVRISQSLFKGVERIEEPFRRRLNISTASHFIEIKNPDTAGRFALDKSFDPEHPPRGRERSAKDYLAAQELAADRRFFHWPLEFPEVFFGIREETRRHMEIKTPPIGGFDAIVGNPPYVRQEALKVDKKYFKAAFAATYEATCDLYVYFMQRETELLRAGGIMSMIVANKWLRANYGKKLRRFLLRYSRPASIIDFGHSPIFPDADTFPCVPVFHRRERDLPIETQPPDDEILEACQLPRDEYECDMLLTPYVRRKHQLVETHLLDHEGWILEDARVQLLLRRIVENGTPLGEFVGHAPCSGIKTGFNEALYIDEATRASLIRDDAKAAGLIKPLIRGRDIDRWRCRKSDMYMITIPSTGNAEWLWSGQSATQAEKTYKATYPSIYTHLVRYRERLIARQDQGKYWWELRQCDYYDELEKTKIVVQCIGYHSRWAEDASGGYINNKAYLIPSCSRVLLAVLNSPLVWWVMWRTFPHMKDEAFSIDGNCIERIPVPPLGGETQCVIQAKCDQIVRGAERQLEWEQATLTRAAELTGTDKTDERVLGWLRRSDDDFVRLVHKASGRQFSAGAITALREFRQKSREELAHLLSEQLRIEERLAALVEKAYGLTPEERRLLRNTRPIRDPIDVLESRIAGLYGREGQPPAEH